MKRTFQRRTRRAFVWVLAIPLLLGLLCFWAAGRFHTSIRMVSHTQEVIIALQDLRMAVTDAESSQRGYLLTEDAAFFSRYTTVKSQFEEKISHLRTLLPDNKQQEVKLNQLAAIIRSRIEKMDQILSMRQQGHLPGAEAMDAIRQGSARMSEIRRIENAMQAEERRLLAIRLQTQGTTEIEVAVSFLVGMVLILLLLHGANRIIQRYSDAQEEAEHDLMELNAELEARVQERTEELQYTNERLRRSNADLTHFAYVASHDLQEPLRTVGSYAALLGRRYQGQLDEQADRYIHHLVEGAKRMQTLVHDLLAYSRIGTQSIKMEPVALESVLQQVKEGLEAALLEKRATITHDPLPVVTGDAGRLGQVLQNLIANALKFGKPDQLPVIHIGSARKNRQWELCVRDNGIGFEPEYAERIFIIFQRLHRMGTYPGTGIGLAVCKRIVEAHGGRIWAESQIGVGSTFFFTLPLVLENKRVDSAESRELVPPQVLSEVEQ